MIPMDAGDIPIPATKIDALGTLSNCPPK